MKAHRVRKFDQPLWYEAFINGTVFDKPVICWDGPDAWALVAPGDPISVAWYVTFDEALRAYIEYYDPTPEMTGPYDWTEE